ncbi:hypothetical protein K438DRAFT_1755112 [Mycena galopus ATCC 62051]|nr:hypothetical protein K438DRAFT_1755112 [Mycena galopus ATCC 62051]
MPFLRHLDLVLGVDAVTSVALGDLPLLRSVALNDIAASRAVNLLHCKLGLFCSIDLDGSGVVDITHLRLESLVLHDPMAFHEPDYQPWRQYLQSFNTPALRSLCVPERFLGPNHILSLKEFMSKSGSNLREVCIVDQRFVPTTSYREELHSIPRWSFDSDYDSSADEQDSLADEDYWFVDDSDAVESDYVPSTDSEEW